MDANTPATRSTSDGNPIQDEVEDRAPGNAAVGEPAGTEPAATVPPARVPAAKAPARPGGLNISAIIVGLVAVALAGLIVAKETLGWRVDWSHLGPGGIVGIGVVMVLIGAIGLVRRHDDV